nr:hypothetical protein CFP56_01356 [Quercus suber]
MTRLTSENELQGCFTIKNLQTHRRPNPSCEQVDVYGVDSRIGDVNNAGDVSLHRGAGQQEILNHPQTRLPICDCRVEVVLFAVLIHAEAFEIDVAPRTKSRLDRPRGFRHLDRDFSRHLDRPAEADLAIALREVQIAHRELRAFDMDCSCTFLADLLFDVGIAGPRVYRFGFRRESNIAIFQMVDMGTFGDKLAFTVIPEFEDLRGGSTAKNSWVDEAGKTYARDVTGRAVDAFKVPNRLRTVVDVSWGPDRAGLNILNVDHKDIARLCRLNLERSTQIMDFGKIDVLDIVGGVVVPDLAASPIDTLYLDSLTIFDGFAISWD